MLVGLQFPAGWKSYLCNVEEPETLSAGNMAGSERAIKMRGCNLAKANEIHAKPVQAFTIWMRVRAQ
jgi:hypothetical protein